MKRFKNDRGRGKMRKAIWPDSPDSVSDIFEPRHAYRKLKVVVDAHLLRSDYSENAKLSEELLLESLLHSELIEAYRYADVGPPENVEPIVLEKHTWLLRNNAYIGWVVAHQFDEKNGFWPVTHAENETSFANTFVGGNVVQIAETDEASKAYRGLDKVERASRRKADMLAHEVAVQGVEADIFITDREYLLDGDSKLGKGRGILAASVRNAIPLLSLYLRAQGVYKLPMPTKNLNHTVNRGLFYWVGTRELIPEGWRWFSTCVYHSGGSGNDKLLGLGGSTLSRVQRAIEARDRVHVALNRKTNNDINDDALGNLDHVLTLLMGTMDATARVAHYTLKIPSNEYEAAWQKAKWLKKIETEAPELASLFNKGSVQWHGLEILRLLRNSLHGEALQGVTLDANGEIDTVMKLPKKDEVAILASMDALGGREAWGYRPFAPGHDNIRPGLLVDRLMEECIKILNEIMKATPVERLSHIEEANLQNKPPTHDSSGEVFDVFSEWNRKAIRWQLGFWD